LLSRKNKMHFAKITILTACLMLLGITLPAAETQLNPAAPGVKKAETKVFIWRENGNKLELVYAWNKPAVVYSVSLAKGQELLPGREIMILAPKGRSKATVIVSEAMQVVSLNEKLQSANTIVAGDVIMSAVPKRLFQDSVDNAAQDAKGLPGWGVMVDKLWKSTGIYDIWRQTSADPAHTWHLGVGRVLMMLVGVLLIGLAIFKGFEPLLLLPIGFGAILANIPIAAIAGPDGLLGMVYVVGIKTTVIEGPKSYTYNLEETNTTLNIETAAVDMFLDEGDFDIQSVNEINEVKNSKTTVKSNKKVKAKTKKSIEKAKEIIKEEKKKNEAEKKVKK